MPELERPGPNAADGRPDVTSLSDAELTERIRAGAPTAQPATQELRRRHLPAVLAYARLCGRNQIAGNQLAVQAFGIATQEACRGIGPRGNWRHHLLLLVQRVGLIWASDSRRERLEPDFVAWIDDTAEARARAEVDAEDLPESRRLPFEASAAMLTGFYRLPELTRNVLWYAVVDQEPDATVATFLRIHRDSVADVRQKAEGSLRRAFLEAYLERSRDGKCLGFRRIIEAAARPGDPRRSGDLVLHLAECPRCTWLVEELTRMARDPRSVFAEGLLRWGGTAYASGPPVYDGRPEPAEPGAPHVVSRVPGRTTGAEPSHRPGALRGFRRPPSRSVLLVAAAVAVAGAVLAGTLAATASEGPRPRGRAAEPPLRAARPTPTVATVTPSLSPSPTPSLSPSPSPTPTPTRTPSASASSRPSPSPSKSVRPQPVPLVPGRGYTQVVNSTSGLCLDIENGVMENRTDVIAARCTGARTQSWSVDPIGLVRSGADPDYCLDSRGDIDRGAGIWTCSSVYGRNGLNLLFTVDGSGVVRPRIAPDFALEPFGGSAGSTLGFDRADGSGAQRWTSGPSMEDQATAEGP